MGVPQLALDGPALAGGLGWIISKGPSNPNRPVIL